MDATMHRTLVGSRLRITLEALNLSQADVARIFEVSPSKLGNWLRGDNYPNEWFLVRFCERYNITSDWILRGVVAGVASPLADDLWRLGEASSADQRAQAVRAREP